MAMVYFATIPVARNSAHDSVGRRFKVEAVTSFHADETFLSPALPTLSTPSLQPVCSSLWADVEMLRETCRSVPKGVSSSSRCSENIRKLVTRGRKHLSAIEGRRGRANLHRTRDVLTLKGQFYQSCLKLADIWKAFWLSTDFFQPAGFIYQTLLNSEELRSLLKKFISWFIQANVRTVADALYRISGHDNCSPFCLNQKQKKCYEGHYSPEDKPLWRIKSKNCESYSSFSVKYRLYLFLRLPGI